MKARILGWHSMPPSPPPIGYDVRAGDLRLLVEVADDVPPGSVGTLAGARVEVTHVVGRRVALRGAALDAWSVDGRLARLDVLRLAAIDRPGWEPSPVAAFTLTVAGTESRQGRVSSLVASWLGRGVRIAAVTSTAYVGGGAVYGLSCDPTRGAFPDGVELLIDHNGGPHVA